MKPTMIHEMAPVEVTVYRSALDGALVVQVDTDQNTGRLRLDLNDATVYDGNPEEQESPLSGLEEITSLIDDSTGEPGAVLELILGVVNEFRHLGARA